MLLLHPPAAIPSEPPAGIAMLAGTLAANGIACTPVDLNIEGILHLLQGERAGADVFTARALRNREANLAALRNPSLYGNFARYRKAVEELNRLLETAGDGRVSASLANSRDSRFSPQRSADLLAMAEKPQRSLFHPFFKTRLEELFDRHAPATVGLSINYLSQALNGFALMGLIRQLAPRTTIIAGGGLITSWMRSLEWRSPFAGLIDHCIAGCGRQALLELHGVVTPRNGLPDYASLTSAPFSPGPILPLSGSSGCYWNRCSFCPEQAEGTPFANRSTAAVHHEISQLGSGLSPVLLHFLDSAMPPRLLASFNVDTPGLPWYGFVRISPHLADVDFCRRLRRSGCVMLKLGLESGDQGVLDRMNKGIDLELASRVLAALAQAGITTYVYLLFGTPEEDEEAARKTLQFTLEHHRCIGFLNLAIFNMPVNSGGSEILTTSPFYGGDLSLYTDFVHPRGWSRRKVRLFLDRVVRRQKPIAAILRREPPHFSSNHAPFFCPQGPFS